MKSLKSLTATIIAGALAVAGACVILPACTSTGSIDTAAIQEGASALNGVVNELTESGNVSAITEALTAAGVIDSTQAAEITAIAAVANSVSDSLASSSANSTASTMDTKAIKSVSGVKLLEAQAIKGVLARGFDASKLPTAKAKLASKGLKF